MRVKEYIANSFIKFIGFFSKDIAISIVKETNAIRLVPFHWLSAYLKKHSNNRKVNQYIDIGTNDGKEMNQLIKEIGPFESLHAIEPNPEIAKQLEIDFPTVNIHAIALGESEQEASLVIPIDDKGNQITVAASINTTITAQFDNCISYPVSIKNPRHINIDWSIPSLIKIDAEGAELLILQSLLPILHPSSIVCVEDHWAVLPGSEQDAYKTSLRNLISDYKSKGILFTKWM